ncbi:LptA/OstA family protein [Desulfobacula sp.]|uniref:LptA/OstA family protein n=1 Tax=Desulfobacula sp. TaxID=2593537 RepID=UPI0039B92C00
MKTLILNKSVFIFLFYLIFIGFIFFLQITTIEAQTPAKEGEVPLHIVSDKMIAQKNTSMVEFTGNVKATREDFIVFADSIKIYFVAGNNDKESDAQSNVKKIVSTGNVRYIAGEQKAYADKAVYTAKDEILILSGKSPKLTTGSSFVTGKKITLFRLQDKVLVESEDSKRVEAFFNPEDNIIDKQ